MINPLIGAGGFNAVFFGLGFGLMGASLFILANVFWQFNPQISRLKSLIYGLVTFSLGYGLYRYATYIILGS